MKYGDLTDIFKKKVRWINVYTELQEDLCMYYTILVNIY